MIDSTRSTSKVGLALAGGGPEGSIYEIGAVRALDEALESLAAVDPRQARIVELRYFTGLSVAEVAEVEDISPTTVKREWRTAKLWLYRELLRR